MKTYAVMESGVCVGHITMSEDEFITVIMPSGQTLIDDVTSVLESIQRKNDLQLS